MAGACYNSADLLAARFSLIDTDGSPLCSETDGSAYTLTPVSLAVNPTVDAGESNTQRDGQGNVCYTRTDADVETGADLVLTLCTFDIETISLLIGAEALTVNGLPGMAKGVVTADPVESHFWTRTKDGSSDVASPNTYWHHVFPKVTWTLGNFTFQRDALQMVLNGTAVENGNLDAGGFSDIPTIADPYWYAVFTAADIPDADVAPYNAGGVACGFVDTPACSS